VEIAEMIKEGTEIIIGARRDRTFGPIVMVGLGGIYVEVLKDVSFRAFPLERQEVMNMIKEIRSYALLLGVRGEEARDIDALIETIIRIGYIIINCKEISDIEINPLMVYEQGRGAMAVDARILLEKGEVS
jgi:acetyltransferase